MTDIAIRKTNDTKPTTVPERASNPWGSMRSLLSWDPFREVMAFPALEEGGFAMSPPFDVKETADADEFKADVPGIQEKDLEVSTTGSRLTVSGRRDAHKEERGERYCTYERSYGSCTRELLAPRWRGCGQGANVFRRGCADRPRSEEARDATEEDRGQIGAVVDQVVSVSRPAALAAPPPPTMVLPGQQAPASPSHRQAPHRALGRFARAPPDVRRPLSDHESQGRAPRLPAFSTRRRVYGNGGVARQGPSRVARPQGRRTMQEHVVPASIRATQPIGPFGFWMTLHVVRGS